jgi:hypothetical protein
MMHLTDEEMMEQIYGESENTLPWSGTLRLPGVRDNFAELERDLAGLDRVEAPERDAHYGERVWASIAPCCRCTIRIESGAGGRAGLEGPGLCGGMRLAGCLRILCGPGGSRRSSRRWLMWSRRRPQAKQPIVVVVLDDHLDRSERFLVELKHADMDSAAMASPMRDEARSLLAANRVAARMPRRADDPELTTALDHLDRLLAEAANEPGGLNAQIHCQTAGRDEHRWRALRGARAALQNRASQRDRKHPAKGGTI